MNDRGEVPAMTPAQTLPERSRQMTEPALYKHRPTVVPAEHYTYDNLPAVKAFLEQRIPGSYQFSADDSALSIDTHEGERAVCIEENYMIVEGLPCDVYPVRKDRFDRLYEPAVITAPDAEHDESWHQGFTSGYKLGGSRGGDYERQRIMRLLGDRWPHIETALADLLDGA